MTNKINNLPEDFKKAIPVMKKIINAGFEAYFVGGSVRDLLLNKAIHDIDIATSGFPSEIKEIFKNTIDVGIEHGTVLVLENDEDYEITTFRTESEYQDYRRPDEVVFVRNLEEDLKRRDFTINALAMTIDGEIVDLFEGKEDLNKQLIKAVGLPQERFNEDALRMMRAVRFASQLDFSIEQRTQTAILENSELLKYISIERIRVEFIKMLQGIHRNRGLDSFISTDLYYYCPGFSGKKEILAKLQALQPNAFLSEAEVWTIIAYYLKLSDNHLVTFLKSWKLPNKMIQTVSKATPSISYRLENNWTAQTLYHLTEEQVEIVEHILWLMGHDNNIEQALKAHQSLPIHQLNDLALSGSEIIALSGKKPGPWLGVLLKKIGQEVVQGNIPNNKPSLTEALRKWGEIA